MKHKLRHLSLNSPAVELHGKYGAWRNANRQVDQVVMHFARDGLILLKDSPEAQDQMEARMAVTIQGSGCTWR